MNDEAFSKMKDFDDRNIIKQVIFIGVNGKIMNMEFDVEVDDGN